MKKVIKKKKEETKKYSSLNIYRITSEAYLANEERKERSEENLDIGGVELKASQAFLLSFRNSSAACKEATAIPWDFSVFPSSRISP